MKGWRTEIYFPVFLKRYGVCFPNGRSDLFKFTLDNLLLFSLGLKNVRYNLFSEEFARRNAIGRGQMNLKYWLAGTSLMPTSGQFCCILNALKIHLSFLIQSSSDVLFATHCLPSAAVDVSHNYTRSHNI